MSKLSARDRAAFEKLDRFYAEVPEVHCKQKCGVACGSIPLTDLEAVRLARAGGRKPKTIPVVVVPTGEARERTIERCVYLQGERVCKVYDVRPLICRVWGAVKMLSCPHGCVPDRWLSDLEFLDLAQRIERVAGGRVLRTTPEGLAADRDTYEAIAARVATLRALGAMRSEEAIEADADRTLSLRAIFGGRIIRAIDERDR